MGTLNDYLDFSWHEVKVPVIDTGYWNGTMIDDYQWHRAMKEPEESRSQEHKFDTHDKKLYI